MKFQFRYKNKNFKIKVEKSETILEQTIGLMFKKNSLPLLFIFKKPKKYFIHSFFCQQFIAVWFLRKKVIEISLIKPNAIIKINQKSDKLLEIPINDKNFKLLETFLFNQTL